MKKIIIAIVAVILIGAGVYFLKDSLPNLTSSQGQLRIESSPKTNVFINSENKGTTPYIIKVKPGDYDIRLEPSDSSVVPWQKQVNVKGGVETFILINLGSSESSSSWQMVTLEKIDKNETELSIYSQNDASEIFLNGERKGTTPLSIKDIKAGKYELRLVAANHSEDNLNIEVKPGVSVQVTSALAGLASQKESTSSAETEEQPNESTVKTTKVQILDTPTGWLRVREEPATTGKELVKVNPGEEYVYVEEKDGWFKIEYEKGKEGWISADYAKKVE